MLTDLLAGTIHSPVETSTPAILVFDSGVGGLTVYSEIAAAYRDARLVYVADDAGFPYGPLSAEALTKRVLYVLGHMVGLVQPDLIVIACNTASTLVLPPLRAHLNVPIVGTVPAIKPAALASHSRIFSVLATSGTVARDYTLDLIAAYADGCEVTLIGAKRLAGFAEAELRGEPVSDEVLRNEIQPAFVETARGRTDTIVLACTHYPLLKHRFEALAPWPVTFIDPGPAIARRVGKLLSGYEPSQQTHGSHGEVLPHLQPDISQDGLAIFTGGAGLTVSLKAALAARGIKQVVIEPMPTD